MMTHAALFVIEERRQQAWHLLLIRKEEQNQWQERLQGPPGIAHAIRFDTVYLNTPEGALEWRGGGGQNRGRRRRVVGMECGLSHPPYWDGGGAVVHMGWNSMQWPVPCVRVMGQDALEQLTACVS